MINLLPLREKQAANAHYRNRLLIVSLFLVTIVFIVGAIFLLPALFLGAVKERSIAEQIAIVEKSSAVRTTNEIDAIIQRARKKISLLSAQFSPRIETTTVFQSIVEHKPRSVSVQELSYSVSKDSEYTVRMRGNAQTRSNLLNFVEVLEDQQGFSRVDLPIRYLVEDVDVFFSMTMHLDPESF